jgi:hypothetical protein
LSRRAFCARPLPRTEAPTGTMARAAWPMIRVAAVFAAASCALLACMGKSMLDGGGSLGDAASGCDWRGHDAGQCSSSAQCPSTDYCDPFGVAACLIDAGPLVIVGSVNGECFPICNQQSCTADEDCDPSLGCYRFIGTPERCVGESNCLCTEGAGGLPPPTCPAECPLNMLAHLRGYICECGACDGGSP